MLKSTQAMLGNTKALGAGVAGATAGEQSEKRDSTKQPVRTLLYSVQYSCS